MTVGVDDFLVICAFRYALGRSTYAVQIVAAELTRLAPTLSLFSRELVIREIDEEARLGTIGMTMDHQEWMRVRDAMRAVS